jgi:predicted AlkP superfamily pyrophosphatase or phosphodiesterase
MPHCVLIVSFDGGKPSVMRTSAMPRTLRMADRGACTWACRTVVPSITLPSHTSMLTGVGPETHKIDWNDYKPEKGVVGIPTVFTQAKARGLTTGLFAGKEKFAHLNVPGSLDGFSAQAEPAASLVPRAAEFVVRRRPNLVFVHFPDPDSTGHDVGWGSREQRAALAACDDALGVLLAAYRQAGLERALTVILSADHGGHAKTHGSNRPDDVLIPWIAWGRGIRRRKITDPVYTCDTAATALHLLGIPIPESFEGSPVFSALR